MIKFLGRIDGVEPLLGMAISDADLRRLQAGEPLCLGVGDIGGELRIRGETAPPTKHGVVVIFRADENEVEARFRELAHKNEAEVLVQNEQRPVGYSTTQPATA